MSNVRKIIYFDQPGPHNTSDVIKAVKERIKEGDIKHVVVASMSGETALKVAEELEDLNTIVVCVSGPPGWRIFNYDHPSVKGEIRKKLEDRGVTIVDKTPSTLSDTIDYGLARYGYVPASWFVAETLEAIGGYGLKTAVEVILMATDSGAIPPYKDVISMAGHGKGADTAIIAKSTYSPCMFSKNSTRRFQLMEIITMLRVKKWYKTIGVGEFFVQEIEKGETLGE